MNLEEKKKKTKNLREILRKLNEENKRMEELIIMQNTNIDGLNKELEDKKEIRISQMDRSQEKAQSLEKTFFKMKATTLKEIEENEKLRQSQILKENHCIKIILGLDVIQKYFIATKSTDIDYNAIYQSSEYTLFAADKFNIVDDNDIMVNTPDGIREPAKGNKIERPIKLKWLVDKLNGFNIQFEQLDGFASKIINKTNFYKTNIINFNSQVINLEGKKDLYSKKVKGILAKNYKNFEDLVKSNSRFNKFIETYSKVFRQKSTPVSNIQIEMPQYYDEFFNKCYDVIANIKAFLDYLITL